MPGEGRSKVFVCYSHADSQWFDRLVVHLSCLERDHGIDWWADAKIKPGSDWRKEIKEAVDRACVAVLIISADFLHSEFIRLNELPPLLRAADEDGALILPIIGSPCLFDLTPGLGHFHCVNDPAAPLVSMSKGDQEQTFVNVAKAILGKIPGRNPVTGRPEATARTPIAEDFFEERTWSRLVKVGDWIRDGARQRIIGSGQATYLLSREDYGSGPFAIRTRLVFSNFQQRQAPGIGMNAGIVVGWNSDKANPRYYNVLITGTEVVIEQIGFQGGASGRDFRHITEPFPLRVEAGNEYDFAVRFDGTSLEVLLDGKVIQRLQDPSGVVGRVGLRPWRSQMDCTEFVVEQRM